jgi:predicted HTH transcriptional regulator
MTQSDIEHVLNKGEGFTVACKKATGSLSVNLFEKISVFESLNHESYPKNLHLSAFFVQLGRVEELGAGFRKTFKYCKLYSGKVTQVNEGNIFEAVVPLLPNKETTKERSDKELKILRLMLANKYILTLKLARLTDLTLDGVRYYIKKLKSQGIVRRKSSTKEGAWVVSIKKMK